MFYIKTKKVSRFASHTHTHTHARARARTHAPRIDNNFNVTLINMKNYFKDSSAKLRIQNCELMKNLPHSLLSLFSMLLRALLMSPYLGK